jgi:penicillin-binding protein 1A
MPATTRPRPSLGRRLASWVLRWSFPAGAAGAVAIAGLAYKLPIPSAPPQVDVLFDDGVLLARCSLAPDARFTGPQVRISELPPHVWQAVVAIEDRRFFHHYGVDPWAIGRAAISNVLKARKAEGASTITQQLATRGRGDDNDASPSRRTRHRHARFRSRI